MNHYDRIISALNSNNTHHPHIKVFKLGASKRTYNAPHQNIAIQPIQEFEYEMLNDLITNCIRCSHPGINAPSQIDYSLTIELIAHVMTNQLLDVLGDPKTTKMTRTRSRVKGCEKELINYAIEILFVQNLPRKTRELLIRSVVEKFHK